MKRSAWLWTLALVLTLASARWQRVSGPTYPLSGRAALGGTGVEYLLHRTHAGPGDETVQLGGLPADVAGTLEWKPVGSQDAWARVPMRRDGDALAGALPHQPPAGRLWYRVRLVRGAETLLVPPDRPAAIRFRGKVAAAVLVPHIVLMFLAMLFSTRAGLEAFRPRPRLRSLARWTVATMLVGGIVLGVFVTHDAFGEWWTGFPVGHDITDSKTLLALVVWLVAALAVGRSRLDRAWVVLAALVTLVIFAIPHSWTAHEPTYGQLGAAGAVAVMPVDAALAPAALDSRPQ
jgi:hypothetical protein